MSSLCFTEEDFAVAWKELDEPQLGGGWQLFTKTMGVHIYRLLEQVAHSPQEMQKPFGAALTGVPTQPHHQNSQGLQIRNSHGLMDI